MKTTYIICFLALFPLVSYSQSNVNWDEVHKSIVSKNYFLVLTELIKGDTQITSQKIESSSKYEVSLESKKNLPDKAKEQIVARSDEKGFEIQISTCYFETILQLKQTLIESSKSVEHSHGIDAASKKHYFRSTYISTLADGSNLTIVITETSEGQMSNFHFKITR
ncbi:MAG: hypothetical protein ACOYLH_11640 [Flavobacteriales bacterium]